MLSLKLFCKQEVRRVTFKNDWMQFGNLLEHISKMFNEQATFVSWVDTSNDQIKVTNSEEMEEAVRIMKENGVISFQVCS